MSKHSVFSMTVLNIVIFIFFLSPMLLSAQVLEEIVVTAQRREQSLQEVPISIESFTGAELQQQGYRNLDDLANFSTTVLVNDEGFLSTERTVRGFGSSGNALTVEQAVPIFIDGLHYGRPAQVKTAFMDLDRVEVLKGPQPVYFGMSAIAGAFNIQSARPTDTWEGYIDTEYGNNARGVLEGAIGGPITDTWGIRVAGKYETSEGFMRDFISGGKIGDYESLGARVIVEWTPTDNFDARLKLEGSAIEKFPEATHVCRTGGPLIYGRNDPSRLGNPARGTDEGQENSVFAPPPQGELWNQDVDIDGDCFGSNKGISNGGPWFEPPLGVREEDSNTGAVDGREAVAAWNQLLWDQSGGKYGSPHGTRGIEDVDSFTGYFDMTYRLDNDIEINSLTGYSGYKRLNTRDNSNSPFLLNWQDRVELYDQWSSELRLTSPTGGMVEWMVGFFWQKTDYDITSNSVRPQTYRGIRSNNMIWEDQEWKTVFTSVTFNFLDERASIDVGGRYVDLNKTGAIRGIGGQFVFDSMPCEASPDDDIGGGNFDPNTCTQHPNAVQVNAADLEFLLPGADETNLWMLQYGRNCSGGGGRTIGCGNGTLGVAAGNSRDTPPNWRSPRAKAVGVWLLPDTGTRPNEGGPYGPNTTLADPDGDGIFNSSEFDPTVTLRYRLTGDHSLYARWATAFKAGGFDTGVTTLNSVADGFGFEPEDAETYEFGSKGSLLDGRARYDVGFFWTQFNDLQTTVATGNPDDPFLNTNAGKQRVRGVEFNLNAAVTEQLTASFAGAFMDGQFVDFIGGCTEQEERDIGTPASNCFETDDGDFLIDRGGEETAKTPDWKFVLSLDYWMPLGDSFRLTSDFKGYISDGYVIDVNAFTKTVKYNQHEDFNLTVGIGDNDDTWSLQAYGRNLLGARPTYNADFDVELDGITTSSMSPNNYKTYGIKFRYNYR